MDFGFTEQQKEFREEVRSFVHREIAPGAKERAKGEKLPRELVKKLADARILGINIPEEYGGRRGDWVSLGIALEEVARIDILLGLQFVFTSAIAGVVEQVVPEVREEWIRPLVRGEKSICFALTEPDCGSDALAMKMRASKKGDHYVINGEKTSISLGMDADAALIFAKTDTAAGASGVSCFLVPLALPGVSRTRFSDMGLTPAGRASLAMEDVSIPAEYLVGQEGRGFYTVMGQLDCMRIGAGFVPLAHSETAWEEAVEYAKQRIAFGRPIAKFEDISFKIAEGATLIEAARGLCYRAYWMADHGLQRTKEAAMCKWWCPQVGFQVARDALTILGHRGYSDQYRIEQQWRDIIGLEIGDGTAEVMKIIISREKMGREFLPY